MIVAIASLVGLLTAPVAALLALRLLDDDGLSRPDRCRRCGRRFSTVTLLLGVRTGPRSAGSPDEAISADVAESQPGGRCHCGMPPPRWIPLFSIFTALLFGGFAWAVLGHNAQHVAEVQPPDLMRAGRLAYHLVLIWLLLLITITDLIDYTVDLRVILVGLLFGVAGAVAAGHFQLIHVWVNWDHIYVSIEGAYLPAWMDQHRHLHGLVWSLAGAVCGASITWVVRWVSETILQEPALGMGDVYIMALIGSFVGWQPALCVLALSPLAGLITYPFCRFVLRRKFVAFGPYLAVSTIVVLFCWRDFWQTNELRLIFSHWPTVAGLVAGSVALLAVLLIGLRIWKTVGRSAS